MTDDASPENLRKFLESDDPALVRMGISLAKGAGVKVTVKDLERFLKSQDVETIKTGIMLADEAGVGDEAMEKTLPHLLESPEPLMRRMGLSVEASDIPEEFYKNVFGLSLWDPEEENRETAKELVKEIGLENITEFPEWLEPFEEAVRDGHHVWVCEAAVGTLRKIGDVRAVELLIEALYFGFDDISSADIVACRAAVIGLGEIGDERAVEPLTELLEEESTVKEIRWDAAWALGKIGEPAVESLIGVLGSDIYSRGRFVCRDAAVSALSEIGKPAVEPLIKALEDEDVFIRRAAAEALGNFSDTRVVESLIKVLGDDDEYVRSSATEALGKLGEPAVGPLIKVLKNEEGHVRKSATEALGEIGDTRAVGPLIKTLGDDESYVRWYANDALRKLGHDVE
jgi:HEAT repeat protein